MKKNRIELGYFGFLLTFLTFFAGCERLPSEDAILPSFPKTAEIYLDDFIDMGSDFYLPFANAKPDVFSIDPTVGYESNSSIRIDVPNANDPGGNYAGAIFRVDGPGRNLTDYDALTFYVKASQGINLGSVGFGVDYGADKYRVGIETIPVGTGWTQVIIPIPDASKLLNERGLFWFSAGSNSTGGYGYTLWFDEIKFERMPGIRLVSSKIMDGSSKTVNTFVGSEVELSGCSAVMNLENGDDKTVACNPAYFDLTSSDPSVAKIKADGKIAIENNGTSEITATLQGEASAGKLIIKASGGIPASPTPTHAAGDVLSIYSDEYSNAVEANFTPGFGGSTSETTRLPISNGEVLQYANNNFTGIMFDNPIDGSGMTHLHIDAYVENTNTSIGIQIRDIGANKTIETNITTGQPEGDDKDYRTTLNGFSNGVWKSFDIPLAGNIANQKNNLGAIIITDGPNFILDNIYFYK